MMLNKKLEANTVKQETESKELTAEELESVSGGTNAEADKAKKDDGTLTPEI